jgi:hypothetical protein
MTPETIASVRRAEREDARGKVHAYRRGWHSMQCIGPTACGLETGRVLGQRFGVRVTSDRSKVTCKRCRKAQA